MGGRRNLVRTESIKLMSIIHDQPTCFGGGQQTLIKLAGEGSRLGIQRFQLRFFCIIQPRTGQHKVLVRLFCQPTGFGVQRSTILPDALHAREQRVVKPDIVRQGSKLGRDLLFKRL